MEIAEFCGISDSPDLGCQTPARKQDTDPLQVQAPDCLGILHHPSSHWLGHPQPTLNPQPLVPDWTWQIWQSWVHDCCLKIELLSAARQGVSTPMDIYWSTVSVCCHGLNGKLNPKTWKKRTHRPSATDLRTHSSEIANKKSQERKCLSGT